MKVSYIISAAGSHANTDVFVAVYAPDKSTFAVAVLHVGSEHRKFDGTDWPSGNDNAALGLEQLQVLNQPLARAPPCHLSILSRLWAGWAIIDVF